MLESVMTKKDLIEIISLKTNVRKKDVLACVDATIETIIESLEKDEKVQITGFGTFYTSKRKKRMGHVPATKEKIEIPEQRTLKLRYNKPLRNRLKFM